MKKKSFETHKFVMAINPINLTLVIDEILEEGEPRFKKKIFINHLLMSENSHTTSQVRKPSKRAVQNVIISRKH